MRLWIMKSHVDKHLYKRLFRIGAYVYFHFCLISMWFLADKRLYERICASIFLNCIVYRDQYIDCITAYMRFFHKCEYPLKPRISAYQCAYKLQRTSAYEKICMANSSFNGINNWIVIYRYSSGEGTFTMLFTGCCVCLRVCVPLHIAGADWNVH